jgi:squalene synthase HpnC
MSVDHYENFPVASVLMPARLRRPVTVIYAYARSADDIADEGDAPAAERLAATIREWRLPLQPFRDLLDAFSQDVVKTRYADFADVIDYCRRSADPVGRLLLHLYGQATPENLRHSDAICSALQLINFWQDVAIDWRKDRVYLPQDDLARFNVSEAQIASGIVDDAWRTLMAFQVDRARAMLNSGAPLTRALPGRIGWELRMIVQGGLRILEKIDRVRGDVFRHRPVLGPLDWPLMLGRAALH